MVVDGNSTCTVHKCVSISETLLYRPSSLVWAVVGPIYLVPVEFAVVGQIVHRHCLSLRVSSPRVWRPIPAVALTPTGQWGQEHIYCKLVLGGCISSDLVGLLVPHVGVTPALSLRGISDEMYIVYSVFWLQS